MKEKEKGVFSDDKYKDKSLRFKDCGGHYEMFFTDEFRMPDKDYTIATDLMIDLKNADKDKELHIYINSFGGECSNLVMLMQHVLEFRHCVTIVSGTAMSAGFLLFCCGVERYVSSFSELMFHGVSSCCCGKASEMTSFGKHLERLSKSLFDRLCLDKILTKDELEKGETTEVWLMGNDLIERKVAKDYSVFKERVPVGKEEFYLRNGVCYRFEDGVFVEYKKSENKRSYLELVLEKEKDNDK